MIRLFQLDTPQGMRCCLTKDGRVFQTWTVGYQEATVISARFLGLTLFDMKEMGFTRAGSWDTMQEYEAWTREMDREDR